MIIIDNRKHIKKKTRLCDLKNGSVFFLSFDWNPNLYLKIKGETDIGLCYVIDLTNNALNYFSPVEPVIEVDAKMIIEGETL